MMTDAATQALTTGSEKGIGWSRLLAKPVTVRSYRKKMRTQPCRELPQETQILALSTRDGIEERRMRTGTVGTNHVIEIGRVIGIGGLGESEKKGILGNIGTLENMARVSANVPGRERGREKIDGATNPEAKTAQT